jgi:anti-repressor protein
LVTLVNDRAMTDSLLIAQKFGKEHKNVLKAIGEILTSAPNGAKLPIFITSTRYDTQGRPKPVYLCDRDSFLLIVMGFTGPEALVFQIEFIFAFNQMEGMLSSEEYIMDRALRMPRIGLR